MLFEVNLLHLFNMKYVIAISLEQNGFTQRTIPGDR